MWQSSTASICCQLRHFPREALPYIEVERSIGGIFSLCESSEHLFLPRVVLCVAEVKSIGAFHGCASLDFSSVFPATWNTSRLVNLTRCLLRLYFTLKEKKKKAAAVSAYNASTKRPTSFKKYSLFISYMLLLGVYARTLTCTHTSKRY